MVRSATVAIASIFLVISSYASPALAIQPIYQVSNDPGGHVVDYDLRRRQMASQGRQVRFSGRCDSACTLYLALPSSQKCLTQGARFGFHLPFGGTHAANEATRDFMMSTYPQWVRDWIARNGGLTQRLKVMTYQHASRFIRNCAA